MHAIAELGFQYCTPVQAEIMPKTLKGLDATGRAQTGTGKTAAFLISILTHILRNPPEEKRKPGSPRALILAPTRELVMQIEKDALGLSKYCPGVRTLGIYGGMDYTKQRRELEHGTVDIMVATPGRLLDFKSKGGLTLAKVEIMVIDEADRMLDMGFIPDVRRIIESTPPKTRRQTMLFSATLTPEVVRLASKWTKDAVTVEIDPGQVATESVEQKVYIVTVEEKFKILYNLVVSQNLERVLVFVTAATTVSSLPNGLPRCRLVTGLLSGDVSQDQPDQDARGVPQRQDPRAGGHRRRRPRPARRRHQPCGELQYPPQSGRLRAPDRADGPGGRHGYLGELCRRDGRAAIPAIEEYMGRPFHAPTRKSRCWLSRACSAAHVQRPCLSNRLRSTAATAEWTAQGPRSGSPQDGGPRE